MHRKTENTQPKRSYDSTLALEQAKNFATSSPLEIESMTKEQMLTRQLKSYEAYRLLILQTINNLEASLEAKEKEATLARLETTHALADNDLIKAEKQNLLKELAAKGANTVPSTEQSNALTQAKVELAALQEQFKQQQEATKKDHETLAQGEQDHQALEASLNRLQQENTALQNQDTALQESKTLLSADLAQAKLIQQTLQDTLEQKELELAQLKTEAAEIPTPTVEQDKESNRQLHELVNQLEQAHGQLQEDYSTLRAKESLLQQQIATHQTNQKQLHDSFSKRQTELLALKQQADQKCIELEQELLAKNNHLLKNPPQAGITTPDKDRLESTSHRDPTSMDPSSKPREIEKKRRSQDNPKAKLDTQYNRYQYLASPLFEPNKLLPTFDKDTLSNQDILLTININPIALKAEESKQLLSKKGLKLQAVSGYGFTFNCETHLPRAFLMRDDIKEVESETQTQKELRLAYTVIDMINTVLSKSPDGILNIATQDPFMHKIAEAYIDHLTNNCAMTNIQANMQSVITPSPLNAAYTENNAVNIFDSLKKLNQFQLDKIHQTSWFTLQTNFKLEMAKSKKSLAEMEHSDCEQESPRF